MLSSCLGSGRGEAEALTMVINESFTALPSRWPFCLAGDASSREWQRGGHSVSGGSQFQRQSTCCSDVWGHKSNQLQAISPAKLFHLLMRLWSSACSQGGRRPRGSFFTLHIFPRATLPEGDVSFLHSAKPLSSQCFVLCLLQSSASLSVGSKYRLVCVCPTHCFL